jgi:membrane fusion protein, copper/silver efflux system
MSTPVKLALVVCLTAAAFFAGRFVDRRPQASASSSVSRQILYWTCPMHPQYKSDHPGDAPCCGMRMVPVYAGSDGAPAPAAPADGAVRISPAEQQLIGVRIGQVERAAASYVLRAPGRVTVDDRRLYRLLAATDGWIVELGDNPVGAFVKRNDILASYYTRDFFSAQQSFFYAASTSDQYATGVLTSGVQRNAAGLNLQVAIDGLRSLGVNDIQIQDLQRTRTPAPKIDLYCPVTGFVLARNISPEQRFEKGFELYTIGDIDHLWVVTDIFEKDSRFLKPGAVATARYRDRSWQARMSDVLPQFDPTTRTLKTRFELDNPGYVLRPGMFVDIELHISMPAAVTVPADALVDTGLSKTVFVDRGNGSFEPRIVQTGWRLGDLVEITGGLRPGERIVISGNFLIDSERRMRMASPGASPTPPYGGAVVKDPVCGMDVDPGAPQVLRTEYDGKTYYFCADQCLRSFKAAPAKYVGQARPAPGGSGH